MNFQGQELISRATYVSNRSLMALALAKILTVNTGLNLDGFTLLGVTPGEANLGKITNYLLVFLAINHLFSWYGDLKSFQSWNQPSKVVPKGRLTTEMTKPVQTLEYFAERLQKQSEQLEQMLEGGDPAQIEKYAVINERLSLEALNLVQRTRGLTWHAKLYLWGWFFAVPAFATAYALWL